MVEEKNLLCRVFDNGLSNVEVVLGDSNLDLNLPFGVQTLRQDIG